MRNNKIAHGVAPPFYVILFTFVIIGLGYMMLVGVPANSLGLIAVAQIFGFLFLASIFTAQNVLQRLDEPLTTSAQGFAAGFLTWAGILSLKYVSNFFSFLQVPAQITLATIQEQIPPFWSFINQVIMAPIVEEMLWGIALPISVILVMTKIGEEIEIFNNDFLQLATIIFIGAITFALFHTSATQFGFFIAAMMFRTFQTVVFYADEKFNIIPLVAIPYSFLVGTHMANNFIAFGVANSIAALMSNPFGMITMLIFASFFAIALWGALRNR